MGLRRRQSGQARGQDGFPPLRLQGVHSPRGAQAPGLGVRHRRRWMGQGHRVRGEAPPDGLLQRFQPVLEDGRQLRPSLLHSQRRLPPFVHAGSEEDVRRGDQPQDEPRDDHGAWDVRDTERRHQMHSGALPDGPRAFGRHAPERRDARDEVLLSGQLPGPRVRFRHGGGEDQDHGHSSGREGGRRSLGGGDKEPQAPDPGRLGEVREGGIREAPPGDASEDLLGGQPEVRAGQRPPQE